MVPLQVKLPPPCGAAEAIPGTQATMRPAVPIMLRIRDTDLRLNLMFPLFYSGFGAGAWCGSGRNFFGQPVVAGVASWIIRAACAASRAASHAAGVSAST